MKNYRKEQYGRSMVEMMGYIAVVMTLTMGIGHIISSAFGDYKSSKANLQVTELANAISKTGAIEENYTSVFNIIKSGNNLTSEGKKIIPASFRVKGNQIYHAFGGKVEIGIPKTNEIKGDSVNEAVDSKYQNKFFITFYNLNRNQCIELAMKDWLSNKYADLYAIIINGPSGYAWYWPAYTDVTSGESTCSDNECILPIKRSAVAGTSVTQDGQCIDNNENTIMWVFN